MSERIHLFLDLENVQPTAAELEQVRGLQYRLWIMHGPHQHKFMAEQVAAWQPLGKQVRFVQSVKSGKNALDLHIAYCMGEARECDLREKVQGRYLIVSRDKDFDALFGYLTIRGIVAGRADTLLQALKQPGIRANEPKERPPPRHVSVSANAGRLLGDLRDHPKTQPTTEKRLRNYVASFLALEVSTPEVGRVVSELKRVNAVKVEGTRIQYSLQRKWTTEGS